MRAPPADAANDPYHAQGAGTKTLELLESAPRYNAWLVEKLTPFLGAKNLELGAGHGTLSDLVARGREVVLTEPSLDCRRVLEKRFAHRAEVRGIHSTVSAMDPSLCFDAVYSANVLEHVDDDVATIVESAERLRPGGAFVAIVPAGAWLYSNFDAHIGHFRRYGRAERERLVQGLRRKDASLELERYRPFNPIGALGWFVRMRFGRRLKIAPQDALLFDRIVPIVRHLDRLPFPFGQSALIVFVKRPDR